MHIVLFYIDGHNVMWLDNHYRASALEWMDWKYTGPENEGPR